MKINLTVERGPCYGDDWDAPPLIVSRGDTTAILKFTLGPWGVEYMGRDRDDLEAVRLAVQSFLDGEIYGREVSTGRLETIPAITFGDEVTPKMREIILIAIDLKTGGDRNKLSETIYRER